MRRMVSPKVFAVLIALILLLPMARAIPAARAQASHSQTEPAQELPYGPYLDEIIYVHEPDELKALKKMEKGELHAYVWDLTTPGAVQYADVTPEIKTDYAYTGYWALTINVANVTAYLESQGEPLELNPFCDRELREALNWLIDREFIVREILSYLGIPQVTVYCPSWPDYMRIYDYMKELEAMYPYDPYKALGIIDDRMTALGAEKIAGKWYYNGKPVTIRILARIEDFRKDIGEYVARILEDAGFIVEIIYCDMLKAWLSYLLITEATLRGRWHIYTAGWVFTALAPFRDWVGVWPDWVYTYYGPLIRDPYIVYLITAGYWPPDPITKPFNWTDIQLKGNWTYVHSLYPWMPLKPDPLAVEYVYYSFAMYYATFRSMEDRNEFAKKIAELHLKYGATISLVHSMGPFCRYKDFGNMVFGLAAGLYDWLSFKSAAFLDEAGRPKVGGTAYLGNYKMFVEPWNPVAGSGTLYDYNIFRLVWEYGPIAYHPMTGEVIPLRANYAVETAGPDGVLDVPDNAIKPVWVNDTAKDYIEWKTAKDLYGEGTLSNATSKVVLNFYGFGSTSKWHYSNIGKDVPMTLEDVFAMLALWTRWVFGGNYVYKNWTDPLWDYGIDGASSRWFYSIWKGVEIINETAIAIYLDYWHVSPGEIAMTACWWADAWLATPWEVHAVMADAVAAGKLAYSEDMADLTGRPWMDYAKEPTHLDMLKASLDELSAAKFRFDFMKKERLEGELPVREWADIIGVTEDEASTRWDALKAWYDELGHFMVSCGSYYLYKVDIPAKMVHLKAHRGYPFKADHFDWLTKKIVVSVDVRPAEVVPGLPATIEAYVTKAGEVYGDVTGKAVFYDPEGRIVFEKPFDVEVATGRIYVELSPADTEELPVGLCRVVFLVTDTATGLTTPSGAPLTVKPVISYMEEVLSEVETSLTEKISDVADVTAGLEERIARLEDAVKGLAGISGLIYTTMGLVAVSLVVSIISMILTLRKPKPGS